MTVRDIFNMKGLLDIKDLLASLHTNNHIYPYLLRCTQRLLRNPISARGMGLILY